MRTNKLMSSQLSLKKFANQRFTKKFIDDGIYHISSNRKWYPNEMTTPSQREILYNRYKYYTIRDEKLVLQITSNKWLQVVPRSDIFTILQSRYYLIGDIGRDRFFGLLKNIYIGISRRDVANFLANQEVHQLTTRIRKSPVSLPIVSRKPMERWQIDLIDMKKYKSPQNRFTKYVLTVVDTFSKYAWVEPLKNKEGITVSKAMKSIITTAGSPEIIQSDNGKEFLSEFDRMLEQYNIKHIKSSAYSPTTNGQIERFNGTLKRMIKAFMIVNLTRIYVNQLPSIIDNYNSIPHTTTKQQPYVLHAAAPKSILVKKSHQEISKNAIKSINRTRKMFPPLNKGDHVRVSLYTSNEVAKKNPKIIENWTRKIFQVVQVIKKPNNVQIYQLSDGRIMVRNMLMKISLENLIPIKKKEIQPYHSRLFRQEW